ncbi:MAG: hypothetical protein ACOYMK_13345 [Hyphomonadaceae bacterium]|jgi:hypothetical protein
MRRVFAILLIATSGWLLYQTAIQNPGSVERLLWGNVLAHSKDLAFVMPALGGALGLLGGLTVLFNGPGGAALAMAGGLAAAGFNLSVKQTFELDHVLENQLVAGACILMLAIVTSSITRVTAHTRRDKADHRAAQSPVIGRRVY